jgi:predicted dithiol-disulfide oxidoreductase (DUF899 family)
MHKPKVTGLCESQSNWRFNADADTGHGFAIFMAGVGPLQSLRSLRRRLTWALELVSSDSAAGPEAWNRHRSCRPCDVLR